MPSKSITLAEPAPSTPDTELMVMEYHLAGAPHRGTHVRIRRCATSGPDAELWQVLAGGKMLTTLGQAVDAHPWHALRQPIRRQVGHPWDQALKLASKIRV